MVGGCVSWLVDSVGHCSLATSTLLKAYCVSFNREKAGCQPGSRTQGQVCARSMLREWQVYTSRFVSCLAHFAVFVGAVFSSPLADGAAWLRGAGH